MLRGEMQIPKNNLSKAEAGINTKMAGESDRLWHAGDNRCPSGTGMP
jgi:hypothetical protein